jgi:hypothetical protein
MPILKPTTARPGSKDYPGDMPGEWCSDTSGHTVTYPLSRSGVLRDVGFVSSNGYGGSDFVHFHPDGTPYGTPMTKVARERITAMRRHYFRPADAPAVPHTLVNLTPTEVVLEAADGVTVTIDPQSTPAWTADEHSASPVAFHDGHPIAVYQVGYERVHELPFEVPGTLFIVTEKVARACPNRSDLVVPINPVYSPGGGILNYRALGRLT